MNEKPVEWQPEQQGKKKNLVVSILTSPFVIVPAVIIAVAFIIYTIYSTDVQLTELLEQYQSLSARHNDSKAEFDKRLHYITVNGDGTVVFTVGYRSEVQKQQMENDVNNGNSSGIKGPDLNPDATKVKEALQNNSKYSSKAEALAMVYQVVQPILGTNAAIGLMANVAAEGDYRTVERAYSKNGANGFKLPSGGTEAKTVRDVQYLRDYNSQYSCGFGPVQWSFSRRVNYAKKILSNVGNVSLDYNIPDDVFVLSAVQYMTDELKPGSSYYTSVSNGANKNGGSAEAWAEAFNDYYEISGGYCGKGKQMSGAGSSCKTRMSNATEIRKILEGIK